MTVPALSERVLRHTYSSVPATHHHGLSIGDHSGIHLTRWPPISLFSAHIRLVETRLAPQRYNGKAYSPPSTTPPLKRLSILSACAAPMQPTTAIPTPQRSTPVPGGAGGRGTGVHTHSAASTRHTHARSGRPTAKSSWRCGEERAFVRSVSGGRFARIARLPLAAIGRTSLFGHRAVRVCHITHYSLPRCGGLLVSASCLQVALHWRSRFIQVRPGSSSLVCVRAGPGAQGSHVKQRHGPQWPLRTVGPSGQSVTAPTAPLQPPPPPPPSMPAVGRPPTLPPNA